jgi:hypothetical protein
MYGFIDRMIFQASTFVVALLQAAQVFQTKEGKSAIVVLSPLGVDSPAGRPHPN